MKHCTVTVTCDTGMTWTTRFNGSFADAKRYFTGFQTTTEDDVTSTETVHKVTSITQVTAGDSGAALEDLRARIRRGEEFPDAAHRSAKNFKVNQEALEASYMEACA